MAWIHTHTRGMSWVKLWVTRFFREFWQTPLTSLKTYFSAIFAHFTYFFSIFTNFYARMCRGTFFSKQEHLFSNIQYWKTILRLFDMCAKLVSLYLPSCPSWNEPNCTWRKSSIHQFYLHRCQLLRFGLSSYDFTPCATLLRSCLHMLWFSKKIMFFWQILLKNSHL